MARYDRGLSIDVEDRTEVVLSLTPAPSPNSPTSPRRDFLDTSPRRKLRTESTGPLLSPGGALLEDAASVVHARPPPQRTEPSPPSSPNLICSVLFDCFLAFHAHRFNTRFQGCVTVLACCLYAVETYYESTQIPLWLDFLEVVCASVFIADYSNSLYVAQSARKYALSSEGLIDLCSILPVIRLFSGSSALGFLQFIRLFKVLRVLRLHNLRTMQSQTQSAFVEAAAKEKLFNLCFTIFSLLFISTGLIHMLDRGFGDTFLWDNKGHPHRELEFFDALYFVIVTFSTVGYGDIVPLGTSARLLSCAFIVVAFAIVPRQVNELAAALSKRSPYLGNFEPQSNKRHILVTGNLTATNTENFLDEIFNPCHIGDERQVHQVVLLSPQEPDEQLVAVLRRHTNRQFIKFLRGSPLVHHDLTRAQADKAVAIFVLVDQNATEKLLNEDARAIMRSTAIRGWKPAAEALVVTQLILPSSIEHILRSSTSCCVCADQLKLLLMAKSCLNPGLSTLVCNLLKSVQTMDKNSSSVKKAQWRVDYENGAANEIYRVKLPHTQQPMCYMPFLTAAHKVFEEQNAVLLGVEVEGNVLLNPKDRILQANDTLLVVSSSSVMAQRSALWHHSTMEGGVESPVDNANSWRMKPAINNQSLSSLHNSPKLGFMPSPPEMLSKMDKDEPNPLAISTTTPPSKPIIELTPKRSPRTRRRSIDVRQQELWNQELQVLCAAAAQICTSESTGLEGAAGALTVAAHKLQELADRASLQLHGEVGVRADTDHHVVLVGPIHHAMLFIQGVLQSSELKEHTVLITVLQPVQAALDELSEQLRRVPATATALQRGLVRLVKGSPLVETELRDAGIGSATSLVVLANPTDVTEGHEYLVDAEAIMIAAKLRSFFPGNSHMIFPHLIVELVWPSNICLLDDLVAADASAYSGALFASGSIYSNGILDCLACQAYYNPLILGVVADLLDASTYSTDTARHKLRQIQVVSYFIGKPYKDLFEAILGCGFIALGLYRMAGTKGSANHYVHTNPHADTTVMSGDLVFVVAPD